jgi:hypothetical protein
MWRSSSGSMRLDTPSTSIISNPAAQKTILLDHLKKEAMVIPTPPAAAAPASPGAPKMPGAPASPPPLQVADLGKSMIEGHEVEGKRFTFTPPQAPAPPPAPAKPQAPQMPKIPGLGSAALPKAPPLPKPPQPTVTEVWTSVKLKTPVLTKVTSPAGEQTTYCKPTSTEEPHPSVFEIPPGYTLKKP